MYEVKRKHFINKKFEEVGKFCICGLVLGQLRLLNPASRVSYEI